MGFIREQEESLTRKLLRWQYQRMGRPLPDDSAVEQHASRIVEDAHRIARERGQSVLAIVRELVHDLRRK